MNEEAKKTLLRRVPYGLYVIGVKEGSSCHAFTGSWLTQCSMKPPRVLLGVRNGTHSLELMKAGGAFSVNFIAKSGRKILEQFFKPTPADGNRFGSLGFTVKSTGTPVLDDAVGFLECRVASTFESGDHTVVIGDIVEAGVLKDEEPIVMSDTPWHYGG